MVGYKNLFYIFQKMVSRPLGTTNVNTCAGTRFRNHDRAQEEWEISQLVCIVHEVYSANYVNILHIQNAVTY